MPVDKSDFDHALSLIKKLTDALSQADQHAVRLNQLLIQEVVTFLEKHRTTNNNDEW